MNKALHYLGRYQASRAKLRVILQRFAKRKLIKDQQDNSEEAAIAKAIEDVILLCVEYGYVNDEALAASSIKNTCLCCKRSICASILH